MFAVAPAFVCGAYLVKHKSRLYQGLRGHNDSKGSNTTNWSHDKSVIQAPTLQIASVTHHGRIIEVEGSTEAGAVVMINGEPAATLFGNNTFKHFIGPVLPGSSIITVTAQNDQGGVTTRQLMVLVE